MKDLYCAVLREIATTCNLAVTNCHEIHFPQFQFKILPKLPSPFEIKITSIRTQGFEFPRESGHLSRRGATFENGRGQALGGQPGTPIKPPFWRSRVCSIGRSYLRSAPKAVRYKNRGLRVLLRIGGGLLFTTDDDKNACGLGGECRYDCCNEEGSVRSQCSNALARVHHDARKLGALASDSSGVLFILVLGLLVFGW